MFSLLLLARIWILPVKELSPENWHGHEFLFGFFFSFLMGHLLTISTTWSKNKNPSLSIIIIFIFLFVVDRFLPFISRSWLDFGIYLPFSIYILLRLKNNIHNLLPVAMILVFTLTAKAYYFLDDYTAYAKMIMSGVIRLYIVFIISRMWNVYAKHSFKDLSFHCPNWLHHLSLHISVLLIIPITIQEFFIPRLILIISGIFIYSLRLGIMRPQITIKKPDTALFILSMGFIIYGLILELQGYFEHDIFYYISFNHALYMGAFTLFAIGMMNRFLKGISGEGVGDKFIWLMIILILGSILFKIIVPMYEGDHMAQIHLMLSALSWSAAWGILSKVTFWKFLKGLRN